GCSSRLTLRLRRKGGGTARAPVGDEHGGNMRQAFERTIASVLPLLFSVGCSHEHARVVTEPENTEYIIGREDLLEISVWKDDALTTTGPVRPDGRVGVPMIGDIEAEGKTPHQLAAEISQRLEPVVREPIVSVIVREINSRKFAIVGEVAHPGGYPMRGTTTILHAVALAGGWTEFASKGGVVVIRRGKNGKPERVPVDLGAAVDGDEHVLVLHAGDTVYVP